MGLDIMEDFEDCKAFTLDDFNGWHTADMDQQRTISMIRINGNYWPNCFYPQAWMVWNGNKANEVSDYWLTKYGKQCLISWSSSGIQGDGFISADGIVQDNWLISPQVKGGSELEFDAYATASSVYGNSTIEILTSSTDDNIESFELLEKISVGTKDEVWQHFTFKLPDDAKYVAIRNTWTEFAILLDNLKYTLDINPVFNGYNVYHNGEVKNNNLVTNTSYTLPAAEGKYGVSAVYDLGESALSNVYELLGIRDIKSGVSVTAGKGFITVSGASDIAVYNVEGIQIANIQKAEPEETIQIASGIYIIKTDKGTYKVQVK